MQERRNRLCTYIVLILLGISTVSMVSLGVASSTTKEKFDDGSTEVIYDPLDRPTVTLPAGCTIFHASMDVEGLPSGQDETTLLNFNDTASKGWLGTFSSGTPSGAPSNFEGTAFVQDDITRVSDEDGSYLRTYGSFPTAWPYHHFSFEVTGDPAYMEEINLLWKGRTEVPIFSPNRFGGAIYIWNDADSQWEELSRYGLVNASGLTTIQGNVTDSLGDYIDQQDRLHVFAQHMPAEAAGDYLDTDFVEVRIEGQGDFEYVTDPVLRLAEGGAPVWSHSGELSTLVHLGDSVLKDPIQALSDGAETGGEDDFTIELVFDHGGSGRIKVQNISIEYGLAPGAKAGVDVIEAFFDEDTDAPALIDFLDHFEDDEGPSGLTFEIISKEDDTKIDGSIDGDGHSMSFTTPTEDWHGTMTFGVRVTDGDGLSYEFNSIEVTVQPVNDPPVALGIPDQEGTEDEACPAELVDLWDNFEDGGWEEDAVEELTYTLPPLMNPQAINMTATGQIKDNRYFTCTPYEDFNGPVTFVVEARDTDNAFVRDAFIVDFAPVNDPPEFKSKAPAGVEEGEEYKYTIEVIDIDGDSVDLSLESGPAGINLTLGVLTWVPGPLDVGEHNISLVASDAESMTYQNFTIVVVNRNNGPSIPALATQEALVGSVFEFTVPAEDADIGVNPLEELTFSDDSTLFDIDPATGAIVFTPTWTQVGTYSATIKVVDWKGEEATAILQIDVVFPPGTTAPVVDITSPENGTKIKMKKGIGFAAKVTYGGGGDWNITWTVDGEVVVYGEDVTLRFTTKGDHTVKVVASDGNGTVEDSIVVIAKKPRSSEDMPGFEALVVVMAMVLAVGIAMYSRKRRPW